MTIQQKPFRSDFGYRSPGFVVDATGNLTSSTITTANINATTLSINNQTILEEGRLTQNIVDSSLETVGILTGLTVNGDTYIKKSGVNKIAVINGKVIINSTTPGTIDNIDIGQSTPGKVDTYSLSIVERNGSPGTLNVANSTMYVDSSLIVGTPVYQDNLTISASRPTDGRHAARKDYVDNSVIAFSIAFGA